MKAEIIPFPSNTRSQAVRVSRDAQPAAIIAALGISQPRAVVCLNGGTAKLDEDLSTRLESILVDGLARVASEESLTLITGATDAGIFSMLGRGVEKWGLNAPLIGVAPDKLVTWPGKEAGDVPLEPHHTHFVLVEGDDWGDETDEMYALISDLSHDCPFVAVFAGGGQITVREMQTNVAQQRTMILIAGSGRNTDAVLEARRTGGSSDESIAQIAAEGRIVPFDIHSDAQALGRLIQELLFSPGRRTGTAR
ncbi:MAG TPA: hypothetical protein VIT91_01645 [Chthoniobacterales bacterium]